MRFGQQFRIAVSPSDYDQSVGFYRDVMGLGLFRSWDRPDGRGSVFQAGNGLIEIVSGEGSREAPGFFGAVVEVEDAEAAYRELVARGGQASKPVLAPWGHLLFEVEAPDGLRLIFFQEIGEH